MVSDHIKQRIANSQFKTVGMAVAMVNTHWGRRIEAKYFVRKIYKNGNFVLGRADGSVFEGQQYRPDVDGKRAFRCGAVDWLRSHAEPWTEAIE